MKKMFGILFALVLVVSLGLVTAPPVLAATTIHVPNDYATIQQAIDLASPGDTITVAAGTYAAFQVIGKNNIHIIGAEGATVTTAKFIEDLPVVGNAMVMAAVYDSEDVNIEGINFDGAGVSGIHVCGIAYVDSTGRIADLTVENIIATNLGAGVAIIGHVGTSAVEIIGATISDNGGVGKGAGIYVCGGSTLNAHFNNIVGNTAFGVVNDGGGMVDATYNWWGHATGPSGLGPGHGDAVSGNVDFEPWLGARAVTKTVTNGTVDAMKEADTKVVVTGTATPTVSKPTSNPGGDPPADILALGRYIDVYVLDTTKATEIEIRHYYTATELAAAGVDEKYETYLRLRWWDGTEWRSYSDGGVNTDSTGDYAGYIWGKVRADTEPRLIDLTGRWNGDFWEGPTLPDGCGCFIATAAYGTDTAKEIDILREFRDTVLLPNRLGARLVSFYYRTSPPIADFISQHEVLRTAVRVGFVDLIVKILNWTHDLWSVRRL
jgi:hypothetical protein